MDMKYGFDLNSYRSVSYNMDTCSFIERVLLSNRFGGDEGLRSYLELKRMPQKSWVEM